MNTRKFLVTLALSGVLSTAMAGAAQAKHGSHDPLTRQAILNTITSAVDAGTAADINARQQALQAQRSLLQQLRQADPRNPQAIAEARQNLRATRQALRGTIRAVMDGNPELREQVAEQRRSLRLERRLARFAVVDDSAFELLTRNANESQRSQLTANRALLQSTRANLKAARRSATDKAERRAMRQSVKQTFQQQRALINEILAAQPGLGEELQQLADLADFPNHRHGRK